MRSRFLARVLPVVMLLVAVTAPQHTDAQPLADKLPGDAILYVGWRGTDDMGPGYGASRFKEFLDASQIRELLNQFLPQVLNRLGQEDRKLAMVTQVAGVIVPVLVKHPMALYVGPIDNLGARDPKPRIALLCDAGNDAAALNNVITRLMAQLPEKMPVPVRFEMQGTLAVITVGDVKMDPANTLAQNAAFKSAIAQVSDDGGQSAFAAGYLNYESILGMVDQMALQDDMANGIWQNAKEATGLGGLKRVAFATGFDGKEWGTRAFVAAPKPRTGLLAISDNPPLAPEFLKKIPASSTAVFATRLDWAKLAAIARASATKFGVNPQLDKGIAQVNSMLGLDLEKDLLDPLGDQWAVYSSPQVGGDGLLGMVLVGHPRDAAKLEETLTKLEQLANRFTEKEDGRRNPKITFTQMKAGDVTVHYLAAPILSPAWAIQKGSMVLSLSPQATIAAVDSISAGGKSILDNEAFQAVWKRTNGEKASALSFIDLPKTAPASYPIVLMLSRLSGAGDLIGVPAPAMVLPTLPKLMPLLSAAGGSSWADDDGFHARAICPFPGSIVFGGSAAIVGPAAAALPAMGAGLYTSFSRARSQAKAVSSLSNLRQIGMGCIMYANENKGMLPPDLGATAEYLNSPQAYLSADSGIVPPALSKEQLPAWINANSSYVYIPAGKKIYQLKNAAETVLAHENFRFAREGKIAVVFIDGHAEIMLLDELQRKLAAGNGQ